VTPTFFINGRRYAGTWDESSLADAMLAPLGHRIQSAAFEFVRWGPSSGLLLGLATLIALALSNSPLGSAFAAWWETRFGFEWGTYAFAHSLLHWVNHGLLTVFFFVVGLEIKREFTVGHLATFRSGALPVIAAMGGIVLPAVIYASIAPPELRHGWGIPIGTDTAFAVALIVLLGTRVPIELRVFLTAAVIIDDIVAIAVIALFYTGAIHTAYLIAGGAVTALLVVLNRTGVYGALPYAVCGIALWFFLHEAGLHATLAGVILAMIIPTRPPANLSALLAQAATVIHLEESHTGEAMRPGPSEPALRTLDAIHARIESPADKLLRSTEPWSSYVVLPIFALANAGVAWSPGVLDGQARLICAITLGLVLGKPIGISLAAWLAVRTGLAAKPDAYSWRQLCGAGALGGIGFTMSLFIAGVAFPDATIYAAAKIAIFLASLIAGGLGVMILWPRHPIPASDEK
jgi:NhaA family Na+:H+ antiporter